MFNLNNGDMFKPAKQWIATEKIKKGDLVRVLWKRYMRRIKVSDVNISGISENDVNKHEKGSIIKSLNEIYEADVD